MNVCPSARHADVAIAGGGPTGMMLGCELALAGRHVVVLERQTAPATFSRGFNLNARSLELLDRRGIVERFLAAGYRVPITGFGGLDAPLSLADLESDHRYTLGIPQTQTEALLEARARELGVDVRRGHELTDFDQDAEGVTVGVQAAAHHYHVRVAYLAGCDGGRSAVRRLAGIAFPGTPASRHFLLGDVVLPNPDSLSVGSHRTVRGGVVVIPRPGYVRVITAEREPPADRDAPVTLDALRDAVRQVMGRDVEMADPRWLTRFGDAARQAERYVQGRVVLAGDAAHIHPPAGAQGLNVGLHDAFNLGWKLSAVVDGTAPSRLLHTYHTERHDAGARVLRNTLAQVALGESGERFDALRALMSELVTFDPVHRQLIEIATGVGTRYDMPCDEPHPLLGRLAPNLSLTTSVGRTTLARLLHAGRGLLLDLAERAEIHASAAAWSDRVDTVTAQTGDLPGAETLLIRPDGYTAWATGGTPAPGDGAGLCAALRTWFGDPRPEHLPSEEQRV